MSRKSGPDPAISSSKGAEEILRRQTLVGWDETLKQTPLDDEQRTPSHLRPAVGLDHAR